MPDKACHFISFPHLVKTLASWVIFHALLPLADFFQNQLFQKILSVILSECQKIWIQIRPDILSTHVLLGMIWVQIVC